MYSCQQQANNNIFFQKMTKLNLDSQVQSLLSPLISALKYFVKKKQLCFYCNSQVLKANKIIFYLNSTTTFPQQLKQ